jgi:superfamily II DNA or RNA helicase
VHKEKNDTTSHAVIVKGIQYKVDDAEFNETEYDYRGNPKFSTMISKVCNYNRRSEFILDVLQNELATNPDQQVMILAHNRSLLEYFHDAIEHRKIATVGYYVGGMKEAALKLSESKKVIIATYAMASEGLDIKTLTTLIMASPKTDVCQSVGRILRVKHASPLVIDIIDPQDVFRSQWLKRQTYYIKQRYRIIMTDTEGYYKNNWVVKYTPPAPKAATNRDVREIDFTDADIIEIDEETGVLSVTTETSAKNKMKSTIPKTNGKCLIRLEE